jgi:hypothetical protein
MTTLKKVLLTAAIATVVLLGGLAAAFYFAIYKPIASPMMAMVGPHTLETRTLKNHGPFDPPASGVLTPEQVARFVSVEEAVAARVGASTTVFDQKRLDLEQASEAHALSVRRALPAFADLKAPIMAAKVDQINAMNQLNLSKREFEWIRRELYRAAGLEFTQLDVSDLLAGGPDPTLNVRRFPPEGTVRPENAGLAKPLAQKLAAWRAFGFFGL